MKIRILTGILALGTVILLWPLLWLGLNARMLRQQEPDAAQLFRLAPEALLLGTANVPSLPKSKKLRLLTRVIYSSPNHFERQLGKNGWLLLRREGSGSWWKAGPTVAWPTMPGPILDHLSLNCRRFSMFFDVCDGEYYALTD